MAGEVTISGYDGYGRRRKDVMGSVWGVTDDYSVLEGTYMRGPGAEVVTKADVKVIAKDALSA
jgi:hypothetical protein